MRDDADVARLHALGEAELEQRLHGGLLLGFLLRRAPARLEATRAELDADLEALRVVRPLLVEDYVLRRLVRMLLLDGLTTKYGERFIRESA